MNAAPLPTLFLLAIALTGAAACGDPPRSGETNRPEGYWASCGTSEDCSTGLICLDLEPAAGTDGGVFDSLVCSIECQSDADCFFITCDERIQDPCWEGVCGRSGCL